MDSVSGPVRDVAKLLSHFLTSDFIMWLVSSGSMHGRPVSVRSHAEYKEGVAPYM